MTPKTRRKFLPLILGFIFGVAIQFIPFPTLASTWQPQVPQEPESSFIQIDNSKEDTNGDDMSPEDLCITHGGDWDGANCTFPEKTE